MVSVERRLAKLNRLATLIDQRKRGIAVEVECARLEV